MERYEAYKASGVEWIDEIPKEWEVVPLKALFSFGKGLPITKADLLEDGEPVISYGQIHSKVNTPAHIKQELVRYVSSSYLESNAASITHKGDFLFADTSEDVEGSGNFVFHDLDGRVFAGYHTLILRPTDASCGRYMSYLFQDDQWKTQLRSRVSGVKLFSLTLRILAKASLLLPSVEERQAIADYLDAKTAEVDALVSDCEREIGLLQEYRRAVISEAVTKGLDPDAPMKDSGIEWIGEIPEEWGVLPYKAVAFVAANLQHPSDYPDLPQVAPDRIEKDTGRLLPCLTVEAVGVESDNHLFCCGDVLFSKVRPALNKVTVAPFDGMCSADMYPIRSSQNHRWLMYYMLSNAFMEQVIVSTDRVKMPKVNKEELGGFKVVVPPIDMQQRLVAYLDAKTTDIDSLIDAKQSMADRLREYRRSLIAEAVTGKFKVPGA